MNDKEEKALIFRLIFAAACVCLFIFGIAFTVILVDINRQKEITNIEERTTNTIDSLIEVNDSIKLKVEHLDSVKNAKVIEVSTLDNDSTIKLFYKLVSE